MVDAVAHLDPIGHEIIAADLVVFTAPSDMHADPVAAHTIAGDLIGAGFVQEKSLAVALGVVIRDARVIDRAKQDAMLLVVQGDIAKHLQPLGKHQGQTDLGAAGEVAGEMILIVVHVMEAEAQVPEPVGADAGACGNGEQNAIPDLLNGIVQHHCPVGLP